MSRFKSTLKAIGEGLNNMAIASHDHKARLRIMEIEELMEELRKERDYHIASLYEPESHELVSEHYVRGEWSPSSTVAVAVSNGEGRLTKCEGRAYSTDRDVHPGCPYKGENHGSHEFTLRD